MSTEGGMLMMLFLCVGTAGNRGLGDEGMIRIAEGLEKNTLLKKLDLECVFPPPSFFIHCCISYSFIS
jgi:hypothetical protein